MNQKLKIGILGGSFDPIHNGHLIASQTIAQCLNLDQIILIPAYQQPLKDSHYVSAGDRLNMVKLAIKGNRLFSVSDYEIRKGGKSYSVETLRFLHTQYSNAEFYLIIGTDTLQHLSKWHQAEQLPALCNIVVASRSHDCLSNPGHTIQVQTVSTPLIEISSTKIRELVAKNYDIIYLVPAAVKDYILTNKLYSDTDV